MSHALAGEYRTRTLRFRVVWRVGTQSVKRTINATGAIKSNWLRTPSDGICLNLCQHAPDDHGEKYFQTVREEYRTTRPVFRRRQIVALARVTSIAYGYNREDKHGFRAAGYDGAGKLLEVEV
jgi:hypothetical protein